MGPGLAQAAAQLARSPLLAPAAEALDAETLSWTLARALTAAVVAAAIEADAPVQGAA